MDGREYLADVLAQLRKYRALAEGAIAQVDEASLFATDGPESNSIAVVMKHMAGNMRSRWTDVLTTDGEKPDRRRDEEFVIAEGDTAAALRERWDAGWRRALDAIAALGPEDLGATITIRGEPHTVLQAIQRQLTHYAYHVGQIVHLARVRAGARWRSLSIPRGQSDRLEVGKDGVPYRADRPAGR